MHLLAGNGTHCWSSSLTQQIEVQPGPNGILSVPLTPGDVRLLGQTPLQLLGDVAAQAAECGWGIFTKQQFVQVVLRGLSICLLFRGMVMLRFLS
jgi:hypothetical protein